MFGSLRVTSRYRYIKYKYMCIHSPNRERFCYLPFTRVSIKHESYCNSTEQKNRNRKNRNSNFSHVAWKQLPTVTNTYTQKMEKVLPCGKHFNNLHCSHSGHGRGRERGLRGGILNEIIYGLNDREYMENTCNALKSFCSHSHARIEYVNPSVYNPESRINVANSFRFIQLNGFRWWVGWCTYIVYVLSYVYIYLRMWNVCMNALSFIEMVAHFEFSLMTKQTVWCVIHRISHEI